MTTDADYLDALVGRVAALERQFEHSRRADLERLLTGGAASPGIDGLLPRPPTGHDVSRTLGNILPLNQQTNMLPDPLFENCRGQGGAAVFTSKYTITTTETVVMSEVNDYLSTIVEAWYASKTAGTVATCTLWETLRTVQASDPFHSNAINLSITATGSGTHNVQLRSAGITYTPSTTRGDAPFLVASIKVTPGRLTNTYTNVNGRNLILEIYNETDAVSVGTQSYDLSQLDDASGQIQQLIVSATPVSGKKYQVRVRFLMTTLAANAEVAYSVAEPQLQLAYTPDPGPFTPAIGGYNPRQAALVTRLNSSGVVVAAGYVGESFARYAIDVLSGLLAGDGTADPATLARVGYLRAGLLSIGTAASPVWPATPVGWAPFADFYGYNPADAVVNSINLAANGGSVALPVFVPAPLRLNSVTIRNTDTATARSWEWRLYREEGASGTTATLNEEVNAHGSESFTPGGAASNRTVLVAGNVARLGVGVYWLVIRNTHATSTFGLGGKLVTFSMTNTMTQTLGSALGSTLDLVTGWSKGGSVVAGRLNGLPFDGLTIY